MKDRTLDVYLKDIFVGRLQQNQEGVLSFTYDESYLSHSKMGISISMPLEEKSFKGAVVRSFFSGLLPEETVRDRLARYLGISERNAFALLEVVGGDCAGALSLYPPNQNVVQGAETREILDDKKLKEILELMRRRPMLAGDEGFRLSLAGAQDKLAVGVEKGKILLMKGNMPTTHILKPMIHHVTDSVYNELFCMRLAQKVGLEVPNANLYHVGKETFYLVERYDRAVDKNNKIIRVHQEDFCQALGILPEAKYEREGGPSINQCQKLIMTYAERPGIDHLKLLDLIIFNYLIGNADAHAKNFSLLYKGIKPQLAPAYDLMSTAIYPELSKKMAMKIGGKYDPEAVYLRHWVQLVSNTKSAFHTLIKRLRVLAQQTEEKSLELKESLKGEGIESSIFDKIISVIITRGERIEKTIDVK